MFESIQLAGAPMPCRRAFIGQGGGSSKSGGPGMKQKEQKQVLK